MNNLKEMMARAEALLQGAEERKPAQAIVLRTEQGDVGALIANALSQTHTEEKALLQQLTDMGDTHVTHVLALWQKGGIDLPSYAFRTMLRDVNSENGEAKIFVQTFYGVSTKRLKDTMIA